jgi:hypothetical protein
MVTPDKYDKHRKVNSKHTQAMMLRCRQKGLGWHVNFWGIMLFAYWTGMIHVSMLVSGIIKWHSSWLHHHMPACWEGTSCPLCNKIRTFSRYYTSPSVAPKWLWRIPLTTSSWHGEKAVLWIKHQTKKGWNVLFVHHFLVSSLLSARYELLSLEPLYKFIFATKGVNLTHQFRN